MNANGRFSIVDLILLAVVIPALVIACLCVPALTQVRELAKRTICASNLNELGKGFQMYNNDNMDRWPWMVGKDWDTTPTGKNLKALPDWTTPRCVTALPVILVRQNGIAATQFVCPSDANAAADVSVKDADGVYHHNFSSDTNISYSYASPVTMSGSVWSGVVNGKSDANLITMADKTPAYDGGKADTDWSKPKDMTAAQKAAGMSQNHAGEYINMLYIDCHVGNGATPVVIDDNIYSASNKENMVSLSGALGMENHISYKESYVIGPIRDTKASSGPATSSAPASRPVR